MNKELIDRLIKLARRECFHDGCDEDGENDNTIFNWSGGNVDDAFGLGECAGEVMLAREVLTGLGVDWVEK